eukprot:5261543-Prymnesium_polylepis.1
MGRVLVGTGGSRARGRRAPWTVVMWTYRTHIGSGIMRVSGIMGGSGIMRGPGIMRGSGIMR